MQHLVCESGSCSKCGQTASNVYVEYDPLCDVLRHQCRGCRHKWTEVPMDQQPRLLLEETA